MTPMTCRLYYQMETDYIRMGQFSNEKRKYFVLFYGTLSDEGKT